MDNIYRYDTPKKKNDKIESVLDYNADQMGLMGQKGDRIRVNYYNKLRTNSQLNLGGRRTKSAFKNKKNSTTSLRHRRKYNKKNRKSMKSK
jgi:hypothetical protein